MSNFCALVGGSCSQLQMFTSHLPINRFERHVNLNDSLCCTVLDELPTFTVDEENLRVEITLPSSVNDNPDNTKSWGLVGVDRNGNYQLIFGENKNSKNEAFLTTIYLVAMKKNNEPSSRATYKLSWNADKGFDHIPYSISSNASVFIQNGRDYEIQRGHEALIKNEYTDNYHTIFFVLNGKMAAIPSQKTHTFTLTEDSEYFVFE